MGVATLTTKKNLKSGGSLNKWFECKWMQFMFNNFIKMSSIDLKI